MGFRFSMQEYWPFWGQVFTLTTTTQPLTLVKTTTMTVSVVPTSVGLAAASCQNDLFLTPPLIPTDTVRGIVNFATLPQQQP